MSQFAEQLGISQASGEWAWLSQFAPQVITALTALLTAWLVARYSAKSAERVARAQENSSRLDAQLKQKTELFRARMDWQGRIRSLSSSMLEQIWMLASSWDEHRYSMTKRFCAEIKMHLDPDKDRYVQVVENLDEIVRAAAAYSLSAETEERSASAQDLDEAVKRYEIAVASLVDRAWNKAREELEMVEAI